MPTPKLTADDMQRVREALEANNGAIRAAHRWLRERGHSYGYGTVWQIAHTLKQDGITLDVDPQDPLLRGQLLRILRGRGWHSLDRMCKETRLPPGAVQKFLEDLKEAGYAIRQRGDRYRIAREAGTPPGRLTQSAPLKDEYTFGVVSDTHLCSTCERLDVLEDAYDEFARRKITHVYHCGNLVDGESDLNRYELKVHGITDQTLYAIDRYPQRKGITTYFVTGRCHEGWWWRSTGLEWGRYLTYEAHAAGRTDLAYLGDVEADIELKRGKGRSILRLFHPGGGTSYALSYATQKIVECVPTTAEALTPSGWKTHDQLRPGDIVLGYNIDADRCEWTRVIKINRGFGHLIRYKNVSFDIECTAEHKWPMHVESRGGPNPNSKVPTLYRRSRTSFLTLAEAMQTWRRCRIIQAAPGPSGPGFKPDSHAAWIDRKDAVSSVLQMTSEQRRAFIYGLLLGEGTMISESGTLVFSQRPGPVLDAFRLACFLEGMATSSGRRVGKKMNGDVKICAVTSVLRKRHRMASSFRIVGERDAEVWCPTTELGSWVMRQGDVITITGNSLSSGEKPDILLCGHFHKAIYHRVRGVHVIQAGCCQDQTRWMRSRRLEAHVGFWIVTARFDERGAARGLQTEFIGYYDRGYHVQATA